MCFAANNIQSTHALIIVTKFLCEKSAIVSLSRPREIFKSMIANLVIEG